MRELKVQNSAFKARLGKELGDRILPRSAFSQKIKANDNGRECLPRSQSPQRKLPVASVQTPAVKGNKENEAISTIAVSLVAATPPPPRPAEAVGQRNDEWIEERIKSK